MRFVPLCHQVIRNFADTLAVGNRSAEGAGGIQPLSDLVISTVTNAQRAVQAHFRRIRPQALQINRRALQAVEQGRIAQF